MTDLSFTATLYSLFFGAQDTVTGWYQKGYVMQVAEVFVVPRGTVQRATDMGFYSRHDAEGMTAYECKIGDVVKDAFDEHYLIVGKQPWKVGNKFIFYALDLEQLLDFPFISGFFGFEILVGELGAVVQGFEDGFERGYWAL